MKKILFTLLIAATASATQVFAFPETFSSNDHNMTILRDQEFRLNEIDTNKDFEEQKQKQIEEDEAYVDRINNIKKVIKSQPPKEQEFIEENGEIKIKNLY